MPYSARVDARFARQVKRLARLELHAERHLERGDPRLERLVLAARRQVLAVQRLEQVELRRAARARDRWRLVTSRMIRSGSIDLLRMCVPW